MATTRERDWSTAKGGKIDNDRKRTSTHKRLVGDRTWVHHQGDDALSQNPRASSDNPFSFLSRAHSRATN